MRYTIKIVINRKFFYQHWSDLIDAPVSYILDDNDWKSFYVRQYGNKNYISWKFGNKRSMEFREVLKLYIKRYGRISKETFIKQFKKQYTKDLFLIVPDKIIPGLYMYLGKRYEVILTMYHKELELTYIICRSEDEISAFDISLFYMIDGGFTRFVT